MKLNMKIPTSALKYAGKYRFKKREKGVSSDSDDDDDDDSDDDDSDDDDDDESSVGSDETDLGFAPHLESMTLTEGYGEDYHVIADLLNSDSSEDYSDSDEVAVGDSS